MYYGQTVHLYYGQTVHLCCEIFSIKNTEIKILSFQFTGVWGGLDATTHDRSRKLEYSFFGKLMIKTNEIEIFREAF